MGVDYCVEKPFLMRELMARINILLHRSGVSVMSEENGHVDLGSIVLKPRERSVTIKPPTGSVDEHTLTRKQTELLYFLMSRAETVVPLHLIFQRIWGTGSATQALATLHVHIRQLRCKLEANPCKPRHLVNDFQH